MGHPHFTDEQSKAQEEERWAQDPSESGAEQILKLPLPLPGAASPVATKTTRTFWLQSVPTSWDPAPLSPPGQAEASYFRATSEICKSTKPALLIVKLHLLTQRAQPQAQVLTHHNNGLEFCEPR